MTQQLWDSGNFWKTDIFVHNNYTNTVKDIKRLPQFFIKMLPSQFSKSFKKQKLTAIGGKSTPET